MMKTQPRVLQCAVALLGLALAGGCESAKARHPKETAQCVLSPGRQAPDVELGIESAVRVVLPGPAAGSGLAWEIALNNSSVLEQMGRLGAATDPGTGDAETAVSFYSLKPGRSVIRFVLVRPGERESEPAAMCEVVVHVRS